MTTPTEQVSPPVVEASGAETAVAHTAGMEIADVLERAADLIEPDGAWTQRSYARDKRGREVSPGSPDAKCHCAIGAVSAVSLNDHALMHRALAALGEGWKPASNYRPAMSTAPYISAIAQWNDREGCTQAEVVARLREVAAIARASAVA